MEKKKWQAFLRLISVDFNSTEYFDESLKDSESHKMKSYKGFAFVIGQFKPKSFGKNILFLYSILVNKVYKWNCNIAIIFLEYYMIIN